MSCDDKALCKESVQLPNGCRLYWRDNEAGGRTYYTDEIGGILTTVWDTALTDQSTILACLAQEAFLRAAEDFEERRRRSVPLQTVE